MPKLPSNIWKARTCFPHDYTATDAKSGGIWHIYRTAHGRGGQWAAYKPADGASAPILAQTLQEMGEILARD